MIYYNLDESDYTFIYNNYTFYFSSLFYKEKFVREYVKFIKDETAKLHLRYKCSIVADEMILILLYKKIEKRGFKVIFNGHELRENVMFEINITDYSFES